jgi:hypothetical protein
MATDVSRTRQHLVTAPISKARNVHLPRSANRKPLRRRSATWIAYKFAPSAPCDAARQVRQRTGAHRKRAWDEASDLASQARRAGLALKWLEFGRHGARLSSDRRVTLGGLFSALKGTNGPTNFKRQRDAYQGERR